MSDVSSVFSARLKIARLRKGITQMQLGVLAQIDEYSASARINQYERGKHLPDFNTAERLAAVLEVPAAYFYTRDDALAALLLAWSALTPEGRARLLVLAETLGETPGDKAAEG
ncbi:MAG: helix-turn-helix domain-containing protein [Zoogloeaceae bacterium]|jgi:transcriptional regulator with XRE-family HTH domain|nr:helix-turn-helix domain-containing protein [Zoogloeaceae bacterium]